MEGVAVFQQRVPYVVVGFTLAHLRAGLGARGPRRAGRCFAAFTEWEVRWRYLVEECRHRIAELAVEVSVQTIVPTWAPPRLASPSLVARWRTYVNALDLHERGHAEIACRAGADVRQRLAELPAFPTREALDLAAAAAAQAALLEARERDEKYDAETEHGRLQGAHFAA